MRPDIDRPYLARCIERWMRAKNLTTRGACLHHDGLNPAMISRALNGHVLSAASLLVLCRAIDMDPRDFLVFVDPMQRNQAVTAIGKRETRPPQEELTP